MIKMKFTKFMNGKYSDRGESHDLYILKGEKTILYIGISHVNIWERWFASPSSHIYWGPHDDMLFNSKAGEAVVKCRPDSMNWIIELWTQEDCINYLRPNFNEAWEEKRCWRDIRFCEDLMIRKLEPCLNIAGSRFHPDRLPPRIKQYYMEEQKRLDDFYNKIFNRS